MNKDSLELTKKICGLLSERKAEDIMYLDISELIFIPPLQRRFSVCRRK